jgi:hypothetical protein
MQETNPRTPNQSFIKHMHIISFLSQFFVQLQANREEALSHPPADQTPLNILTTKNQQAPINLMPLRTATLYSTTPM